MATLLACPGQQLRAIAVVHCALVFVAPYLRAPIVQCARAGLVGCFSPLDLSSYGHIAREHAGMFLLVGAALFGLGSLIVAYRTDTDREVPLSFAAWWTVAMVVFTALMPATGLWIVMANSLYMVWLAKRAARGGADLKPDSKGAAHATARQL